MGCSSGAIDIVLKDYESYARIGSQHRHIKQLLAFTKGS